MESATQPAAAGRLFRHLLLAQHEAAICFFHPRQALGGFLDVVIDGGVLVEVHRLAVHAGVESLPLAAGHRPVPGGSQRPARLFRVNQLSLFKRARW
ncbi:hypothetical protein KIF53_01240 [Chromobacterium subtsugae]|uniref:Uncharacterized protein n=1 Tax=Chromobacterium subtsugae TaxID=251747 RepID=A0ABS7F840_9NEIS|nr:MULTISPECIES: hypothetical protein [Chromobacterium]KUM04301.1 hypothetical protein Cv017_15330 [Chromobacterium subtsugae]KZE83311.1 hypothetical protein AWB61_06800 [Chromobacterium sp. F49]MBW7565212.1 hypothetical protein [Chromobacterium subtsugae]MBW8286260.1 hypothetical protein [Chromobacterium subtsugae]OBU87850.1 hypothetical protein MY55_03405 [Chromobacterium subtsugae]